MGLETLLPYEDRSTKRPHLAKAISKIKLDKQSRLDEEKTNQEDSQHKKNKVPQELEEAYKKLRAMLQNEAKRSRNLDR